MADGDRLGEASGIPVTPETSPSEPHLRIRDALTELHAYALVLGGERERIDTRLAELDRTGRQSRNIGVLRRRRADIAAQLELLNTVIIALRAAADPGGRYL
jgi:hypothetical protein